VACWPKPALRCGAPSRWGRPSRSSKPLLIDVAFGSRLAYEGLPTTGPLIGLQRSKRARMSGMSGIPVVLTPSSERQSLAMCGRLSVGKGCLGVLRGWSVLPCVRPVDAAHVPLALMPSAERIPDQEHAFEDALAKLGCFVPGTDRLFALHSVRPSQPRLVAVVRRYAAWTAGSLYRSPLVMIAQMMRAVLLASATAATLVVRRASNCASHGRRVPCRCA
jgi:hypothetical protein